MDHFAPPTTSRRTGRRTITHVIGFGAGTHSPPSGRYSEPERGAPAGCIHLQDFSVLAEDVIMGVVCARKDAQVDDTVPLYLFGESIGGP